MCRAILVLFFISSWTFFSYGQRQDVFPSFTRDYPDSVIRSRLTFVASVEAATYVGGLSYLGFVWYKDHDRVPFHFYNDNRGYLQMDKMGHAFSAYEESYHSYYALRWAGLSKKKALLFGAPMGLLLQTPIEIFDGLYEGWGFSWGDMAANTAGAALFGLQELVWDEQRILMKFSYSPSGYPKYHHSLGETASEQFFLDYNGHTYWLSGNLKSFTGIERLPNWLNLAVGYSGNGMINEFDNPTTYKGQPFPHLDRYRQWLLSLDVDLTRIKTNKQWLASILKFVNIIKIPFPALEINRIDGLKFRPLYF